MKEVKLKRYRNIIYEIYCAETNKYYIGQTIKPLNDRISKHFSDAKSGRKQPLYEDMRKYNKECFSYKEIEYVKNQDDLDVRERYWIDRYIKDGFVVYNVEFGGKKNIDIPYSTRTMQAHSKGTEPFVVYDMNKKLIGRFENISDADKKLGTDFNNNGLSKGQYSAGYIGFRENLNDDVFEKVLNNLEKVGNTWRQKCDRAGENNPMYGKGRHIFVYDKDMTFIKEYRSMQSCVEETKVNRYSIKKFLNTNQPYKGFIFEEK